MILWKNDETRFGIAALTFHWLTAFLVLVMITLGFGHEFVSRPMGHEMMDWHRPIGMTILLIVVLRLIWRLFFAPPPPLPNTMTAPMKWLAHGVHFLLYVCLFVMTLTGWFMTSTGGHGISFYLFSLPPVTGMNKALSHSLHDIHTTAIWVLMGLIVLHLAGALYHQFILKDDVLARMVPWMRRH